MQAKHTEKSTGPHGYRKIMPPTTQTPGSRAVGSHGTGKATGGRGEAMPEGGRGKFSGSPPAMGGGSDWGSPHTTTRHRSTGRGAA